jgi:TolA-binding protein
MKKRESIKKRPFFLVLCYCTSFFLLSTFTGCAQLQRVEAQNQRIQKQLDTLNETVDQFSLAQGGTTRQMKADLNFLLQDIKEQLNRLNAQLDESQYRLAKLENSLGNTKQKPNEKPSIKTDSTTTKPQLDVKKIYHQAREDYITGKYKLALRGFQTVYQRDSQGDYKDNSLYWVGEIYYKNKEYSKAIEFYTRTVAEFPKGDKKCTALFKMGLVYEDQGDIESRNQTWQRLQDPSCKNSNEALQAVELM